MIRFQVKDETFETLPAAMRHIVRVEALLRSHGYSDAMLTDFVSAAFHELYASMTRAATDAVLDASGVLAGEFREAVTVREAA
jgi:hypothetical protein